MTNLTILLIPLICSSIRLGYPKEIKENIQDTLEIIKKISPLYNFKAPYQQIYAIIIKNSKKYLINGGKR
jgi:hypothetical protein